MTHLPVAFRTLRRATLALTVLPAVLMLVAGAAARPVRDVVTARTALAAADTAVPPTPRVRPMDRWLGESRALAVDGGVIYYGVGRSIAIAYNSDPGSLVLNSRSAPLPLTAPDAPPAPITDLAFGPPGVWAITGQAEDGVAYFDFRGHVLQMVGRAMLDAGDAPVALAAIGDEAIVTVGDPAGARQGGLVMLRADAAGVPHIVGRWRDPKGALGLYLTTDVQWEIDSGHVFVGGSGDGQALVRLEMKRSADGTVTFDVVGRHAEPVANVRHLAEGGYNGCTVYGIERGGPDGASGDGLWVFDVCAPTTAGSGGIRVLGEIRTPHGSGLVLTGLNATLDSGPGFYPLVSDANGAIWAIWARFPEAMSWPEAPLVAPMTTLAACHTAVFAHNSTVFATGCGLRVFETRSDEETIPSPVITRVDSLPNVPAFGTQFADEPWTSHAAAAAGRLYYSAANTLSVIDPRAELAPAVLGQVHVMPDDPSSFQVWDVAVGGDTAWVAPADGLVAAVDVRDPKRPRVIGHVEALTATVLAAGSGLLAAMANDRSAAPLKLYDVADPAAPRQVAEIAISVPWFGHLAIADGRLFVAAGTAGLHVIDIHDPAMPQVLASEARFVTALAVADGHLVTVGDRELGVYGLDSFPDGKPVRLSSVVLPIPDTTSVAVPQLGLARAGDRRLAVVLLDGWLFAVDVTDPTAPIAGQPYHMTGPAETMAVLDDRAYVWGRGLGAEMNVFEISAQAVVRTLQLPLVVNGGR